MPRNSLLDLNNLLFGQLEQLADNEIKGEELSQEIERSKAMGDIARQIIDNAKIQLDFTEMALEYGLEPKQELMSQFALENKHNGKVGS